MDKSIDGKVLIAGPAMKKDLPSSSLDHHFLVA
jgi:hypothetical protein